MQNRKVALIGNYTWAPSAVIKAMRGLLESMKNMELIGEPLEINSAMKPEQDPALDELAGVIAASIKNSNS